MNRILRNKFYRQSDIQLEGALFWSCEALDRLPTLPKASTASTAYQLALANVLMCPQESKVSLFCIVLLVPQCCAILVNSYGRCTNAAVEHPTFNVT